MSTLNLHNTARRLRGLTIRVGVLIALAQTSFLSQPAVALECSALCGNWAGKAHTATESTRLILHITEKHGKLGAAVTLPDIGVAAWPAKSIRHSGNSLRLVIPSDSGPQTLKLTLEGSRARGSWTESRFDEDAQVVLEKTLARQSITEQRIKIDGPAGAIGASLLLADGSTPGPALVFLHGSGPQSRDSNRFAAETLAEMGIASIIFDKRGVGESAGKHERAGFQDLAADAVAVARFLHSQESVSRVGFFGHSQGGWIAPLAGASWPDTAFVITSAGPAVSPAREAQWELVSAMRDAGIEEKKIAQARQLVEFWHEGIRSGDWRQVERFAAKVRGEPWVDGASYFFKKPRRAFAKSYRISMDYDPIPALQSLDAPLLAILSPDDESVDAVETEGILRELISQGKAIELSLHPGYDHSLRRLDSDGRILRWPAHPPDYFDLQADFIWRALAPVSAYRISKPRRGK